MSDSIPKIIWQTHNYEYENLPLHYKKATKTWINLNPGWDYRYISHIEREIFIKENYEDFFDIYKRSNPVTQADIWRYLVTYKNGGVYSDMDSICVMPIDYAIKDASSFIEIFIIEKDINGMLNNCTFAVKKESYIMKKIIDYMLIKKDYVPYSSFVTWMGFNDAILYDSDPKHISIGFSAGHHSAEYKNDFYPEYRVNYFGKIMSYSNYCSLNNLSLV